MLAMGFKPPTHRYLCFAYCEPLGHPGDALQVDSHLLRSSLRAAIMVKFLWDTCVERYILLFPSRIFNKACRPIYIGDMS